MWDLPGGIVEDGEDPEEAARRETLEETGLAIDNLAKFRERTTQKGGRNHRYVLFTATTNQNDIRLSYEHDKYMWVRNSDLEALDLPERMKVALEMLTVPSGEVERSADEQGGPGGAGHN